MIMTRRDEHDGDASLADTLGAGYAHVQHLMDRAIEWGFRKMRESEAGKGKGPPKTAAGKAERMGRSVLSFFGKAGSAYFETYERLKAEERGNKK
jgi:hypothetical protein